MKKKNNREHKKLSRVNSSSTKRPGAGLRGSDLRKLTKKLPEPVGVYKCSGTIFEVYCAKRGSVRGWVDPILKSLTLDARLSYNVYGKRPQLDKYDRKSTIYLVRAIYKWPSNRSRTHCIAEAWMSNRFVPNKGVPKGAAELDIARYKGRTVEEIVKKKFFARRKNFLKYILSYSRMCSIPPYVQRKGDERMLHKTPPLKNPHTALCFALICKQFIREYGEPSFQHLYITGLIRDDLVKNALTVYRRDASFKPLFTPAYKILALRDRKSISLDRNVYTYKYPGYFLSIGKLLDLFKRLVREGKLSQLSLFHYLGSDLSSRETIYRNVYFEHIDRLGKLLNVRGNVHKGTISGEELRALVDDEVPDGPELKITDIKKWKKSINDILKAAHVRQLV